MRVTILISLIDMLMDSLAISISKVMECNLKKNLRSLTTCVTAFISIIHIYLKGPLMDLKFEDINIYILILFNFI